MPYQGNAVSPDTYMMLPLLDRFGRCRRGSLVRHQSVWYASR